MPSNLPDFQHFIVEPFCVIIITCPHIWSSHNQTTQKTMMGKGIQHGGILITIINVTIKIIVMIIIIAIMVIILTT